MRNYGYFVNISQNDTIQNSLMKVVLNIFNLSDKPVRLLQIFFDELSDGYNVEIIITSFFFNQFLLLKFLHDVVKLNIRKECKYIL